MILISAHGSISGQIPLTAIYSIPMGIYRLNWGKRHQYQSYVPWYGDGDHNKTAINTTIMTGSIFGFACNIITQPTPKYLPSFTWYSDNGRKVYILEKALQVAKIAMKRRDKEMTPAEEQIFRMVFQLTESERNSIKI